MIKISNIRKAMFTTVIGSFFLGADFVYFIFPIAFDKTFEVNLGVLFAGAFIGLGLWLSPDSLFKTIREKIKLP